jgi:hypothetical protein
MNDVTNPNSTNPRYYLPDEEMPQGFIYPQEYIDFVEGNKPHPVAMIGMPPWIFAGNLIWAKNESKSEFGSILIPFAQAENMDMVAYFEAANNGSQSVWVVNPWESNPSNRVHEKFDNFIEWLNFARQVSNEVLEEKPQLRQRKFWFPNIRTAPD